MNCTLYSRTWKPIALATPIVTTVTTTLFERMPDEYDLFTRDRTTSLMTQVSTLTEAKSAYGTLNPNFDTQGITVSFPTTVPIIEVKPSSIKAPLCQIRPSDCEGEWAVFIESMNAWKVHLDDPDQDRSWQLHLRGRASGFDPAAILSHQFRHGGSGNSSASWLGLMDHLGADFFGGCARPRASLLRHCAPNGVNWKASGPGPSFDNLTDPVEQARKYGENLGCELIADHADLHHFPATTKTPDRCQPWPDYNYRETARNRYSTISNVTAQDTAVVNEITIPAHDWYDRECSIFSVLGSYN